MTETSLGATLGRAMACYRDKDPKGAAEALGDVVGIVRALEDRIARLERGAEMARMFKDNDIT